MTVEEQHNRNEALLFEYDLSNLAKEFWFGPEEHWELAVANAKQLAVLVKEYYPVLSMSAPPSSIRAIRELMVAKPLFRKASLDIDSVITARDSTVWLIAYNTERLRK